MKPPLHALRYWAAQALRSMRGSWPIQVAATGAIAAALLLAGLVALGAVNVSQLTRAVGRGLQVTAYLSPESTAEQAQALQKTLSQHPLVARVRYVSPRQAHKRLQASLGQRASLLDGVEPGFLPASLELELRQSEADQLRPLLALLGGSPVVEEVDYLGRWVNRLTALVAGVRALGIALAVIVCLVCLYIVSSTIRIGVFARRDEIEILRLVGATDHYVRAPFLMQGALQGLAGATVAALLLYLLYRLGGPTVERLMTEVLSHTTLGFLSPAQLFLGLMTGVLLGLVGSRVAVARYMDA